MEFFPVWLTAPCARRLVALVVSGTVADLGERGATSHPSFAKAISGDVGALGGWAAAGTKPCQNGGRFADHAGGCALPSKLRIATQLNSGGVCGRSSWAWRD